MNMPFPSREQVEFIRKNYPPGTRVMLNCLARNPERIVTPQTPRGHSQRLDTLKAELDELISQLPVDENRTREVLREITAEMYADIDPSL